ncbi:hypothetical protein TEQG_03384 [Trichophyton equinum CBS 127.97]|uniref:Uncharacterized protein n=1 Tax=Trichophyton equinum (strain ATCC MYA-4606 / CBS 127.97) TaxID=559882 RepID=F2PRJ5_TRIEC|nr:hypothetical protein TEQG_03384 [Trichophyton equinum CBS 127.97]
MAGSGSPADLQALLARIKPRPSPSGPSYESQSPFYTGQFAQHQHQQRSGGSPGITSPTQFSYAAPYASSPILSPPPPSNPPHHGSDVISPNSSTPQSEANQQSMSTDRANLLKLLKSSQPPGGQSSNPPAETGLPSGAPVRVEPIGYDGANGNGLRMPGQRNISASDILASLRGPSTCAASPPPGPSSAVPGRHSPAEKPGQASTPSGDATQEMLLRLLNQPPAQNPKGGDLTSAPQTSGQAMNHTNVSDVPVHLSSSSTEERKDSSVRNFGSADTIEVTQFGPLQPKAANKGTIFSHINPFEHLAAASSRNRSPNSQPQSGRASPLVGTGTAGKELPKAKSNSPEASKPSVAQPTPERVQGQQTATPGPNESTDQEKRGVSTPEAAEGVEGTPVAISDAKVEKSAPSPEKLTAEPSAPGSDIPGNATANSPKLMHGALEPPEEEDAKKPAKVVTISGDDEAVKNNKLEAKNENVADNWETEAETDRVVPVYNFPLKPFVSITWKTNLKPVGIRDDGVMDIARLKKGFDQLDRSLTSATSEYIVYALAKNGGARIIRQDDGHDRQIFRSTNDRMFTSPLRFWDLRDIDEMLMANKCDIRIPLLTLVTGSSNEKCWPTSVVFIDKQRPYLKAHALRYILVGLKQNHTLQLWDVGLGKAVQELNFPHGNESDAICSIAYHPGSGIIVVGHPTRNSIYFIHLSAPRYALPPMSQATFIEAVTNKDPNLPKPDSTACMSGIREISFGSRGQLRSLELLPLTKLPGQEDNGLFELYVMHSRGVTCLSIKKLDLGWDIDNKIVESVDALEKGYIEIRDIQPVQPADDSSRGEEGSTLSKSPRHDNKETKKEAVSVTNSTAPESPKKRSVAESASTTTQPQQPQQEQATGEKPDKKKKKKDVAAKLKETSKTIEDTSDAPILSPVKQVIGRKQAPVEQPRPRPGEAEIPGESIMSMQTLSKEVQKIEQNLTSMFTASLNNGLDTVYRRFEDDRRAQDKLATIRQDEVLRLVSKTLSENVEKTLAHIVSESIKQSVLPALKDNTASALDRQINGAVKAALPDAIAKAMQTPATVRAMTEIMLPSITSHLDRGLANTVKNIVSAFKEEQAHTAEKVARDVERKFATKMKHLENQQIKDSVKIDQLVSLVNNMNDSMSTIAQAQNSFGAEILKLHKQMAVKEPESPQMQAVPEQREVQNVQPSDEPSELTQIGQLMEERRYEEASIKWLQSSQQSELFSNLFVNYNPSYLGSLSPVVALSVSAAVTASMDTHIMERLNWLQQVLRTVNISDPSISEIGPRIMDILIQRLEALFISIAQKTPNDPILHRIPPITQWAAVLRDAK